MRSKIVLDALKTASRQRQILLGVFISICLFSLLMSIFSSIHEQARTHSMGLNGTRRTLSSSSSSPQDYDLIGIPGGGLSNGVPTEWTMSRIHAAAIRESQTEYFAVLSRGTTHRPPKLDADQFPIDESAASAKVLIEKYHIDPRRILLESWSLDTIGNAFFLLQMHAAPLNLNRILVITSEFHGARTQAIFQWLFQEIARPDDYKPTKLDFLFVPNEGLTAEQIAVRKVKEEKALQSTLALKAKLPHLRDLSKFMFTEHGAYGASTAVAIRTNDATLASTY